MPSTCRLSEITDHALSWMDKVTCNLRSLVGWDSCALPGHWLIFSCSHWMRTIGNGRGDRWSLDQLLWIHTSKLTVHMVCKLALHPACKSRQPLNLISLLLTCCRGTQTLLWAVWMSPGSVFGFTPLPITLLCKMKFDNSGFQTLQLVIYKSLSNFQYVPSFFHHDHTPFAAAASDINSFDFV